MNPPGSRPPGASAATAIAASFAGALWEAWSPEEMDKQREEQEWNQELESRGLVGPWG